MEKKKIIFFLVLTFVLYSFSIVVFATETNIDKNLIITQLNISKDTENTISILYGYPISESIELEKNILIDDEFNLLISELNVDGIRYAIINCVITYTSVEELNTKLQVMKNFNDNNTEWIRFHFYAILDSIVSDLNQQLMDSKLSFNINSSWLSQQKYNMLKLDDSIRAKLEPIAKIESRSIESLCFIVIPSTMSLAENSGFQPLSYSDTETAYRIDLNGTQLKISIDSEPKEQSKIDQFLNSKWYYMFLIGSGLFIVIAIITMLIIAKSFNNVVEKKELISIIQTKLPTSDIPELYLTKEQREALKKNGLTKDKKDLFSMEDNPHKMESIDVKNRRNK